jgi:adenylate cyclase
MIYASAKDEFEFRWLDRVAVKGKMEGISIYELIATREKSSRRPNFVEAYEEAFTMYQRGKFADAAIILETQIDDPPSAVILARCREFDRHPPREWSGIHAFDSK